MATVDILLPAFGIKWAQDGTVEAIDEAQWRAGWSFIGATPPSVEQFNKVHQIQDEKSNYLYAQMAAIYTAAGVTPAAGTLTSLRDAIRLLTGVYGTLIATRVFSTPGSVTYTPTAGTRMIDVEMVGGGGAGGANVAAPGGSDLAMGSGGGGASYARGIFTTGFSGATLTVGTGGVSTAGGGGVNGTSSSLGALITAPGGGSPGAGTPVTPSVPYRIGGTLTSTPPTGANVAGAVGAPGLFAIYLSAGSFQSGSGGASFFGSGASPQTANAAGINCDSPGGGGGGSLSTGGGPARAGGSGGNGRVIIREYA